MTTEQGAWLVVFVVLFAVFVYEMGRRGLNKKFIKAYSNLKFDELEQEVKAWKSGLKTIGEWKSEFFNDTIGCWEMRFRNRLSNYFSVFSNYSINEYFGFHFIDRNYLVYYSIRAQAYKRPVTPYKKKLGWSFQALVYRAIYFTIGGTVSGFVGGLMVFGTIFSLSFPELPFAVLIGLVIAPIISTVNYFMNKSKKIRNAFLKKKEEIVKEEFFLTPLETEEETVDIYKVQGSRKELVTTVDGATETRRKQLAPFVCLACGKEHFERVTVCEGCGLELEAFDPNYKIVYGYDELYKLKSDELVELKEVIPTGETTTRKRKPDEMKEYHRSYMTRNRYLAEQLFSLNKKLAEEQEDYRNLQIELQDEKESQTTNIRKALQSITKEKSRLGNNLKSVYNEIFGAEFVGENFEKTHERVMKKLEKDNIMEEKETTLLLTKTLLEILKRLETKTGIDMRDLQQLFEKPARKEKIDLEQYLTEEEKQKEQKKSENDAKKEKR